MWFKIPILRLAQFALLGAVGFALAFLLLAIWRILGVRFRFVIANRCARRGDFRHAIDLYSSILHIGKDPIVLRLRGTALGALGRHEEAIADFDEALALDPRFTFCYLERGVSKFQLGNERGALEDFEAALTLEPLNYSAQVRVAWMKRRLGHAAAAFVGFERAAQLKPEVGEAWAGMSLIEFDRGALENAVRYAQKALALGGLDKELEVELAKIGPKAGASRLGLAADS